MAITPSISVVRAEKLCVSSKIQSEIWVIFGDGIVENVIDGRLDVGLQIFPSIRSIGDVSVGSVDGFPAFAVIVRICSPVIISDVGVIDALLEDVAESVNQRLAQTHPDHCCLLIGRLTPHYYLPRSL